MSDHKGERSKKLLTLRPILDLPTSAEQSELERFQNSTLRPILKLQHPITLQLLLSNKHFKLQSKGFDTEKKYRDGLDAFIRSNKSFRDVIIGCIIGMMTSEETAFYALHCSECNKRIISMQIQRYFDTLLDRDR